MAIPDKRRSISVGNNVFENLYVYGNCEFDKDVTINGQLKYDKLSRLTVTPKTAAYILEAGDVSTIISITTGGVTVPAGVFTPGDTVLIYNNSAASQTITQGVSATLRLPGTADTGNRTLQQRGLATVLCIAENEFLITGSGLL